MISCFLSDLHRSLRIPFPPLTSYGLGPYSNPIKDIEKDISSMNKRVNNIRGVKESDTGLAPPAAWDVVADKELMQSEQPLQVARCTKILNAGQEDAKYMINVKQIAKFVVGLGDRVAPTDIEVPTPPCSAGGGGGPSCGIWNVASTSVRRGFKFMAALLFQDRGNRVGVRRASHQTLSTPRQ